MKHKLFLFYAVIFVLSIQLAVSQPVKQYGALQVKGIQLCDQNGNPVTLRGVSYGWHNWWPRFYNAGTVKWLANDWGATVVRAAIGVEPKGGIIAKPDSANNCLKKVVDGAIKNGIYVLIDWHSHGLRLAEAKAFFKEMATRYGKFPNIIYEIYNEPDNQSWEEVKAYSEEVIKVIREIDPDNIILVGCPHWDQDIHLVAQNPIKNQSNIMYTVHFYAATHTQWLRDRSGEALKEGVPIFVSECAGMEASGNGPINHTELEAWVNWMETNKVSWIMWSIADKNETCSMLLPNAGSKGKWTDAMLKESGKTTKKYLLKYKGR